MRKRTVLFAIVVPVLVFVAAVLLVSAPAWCQTLDSIPDLKKPVTLTVKGEALSDIMEMLEKQTGVRLRVTRDIADQKATIFIDEKPLSEVMSGLSKLFEYKWKLVLSETRETYELYRAPKSSADAAYEEALAKATQEVEAEFRARKDAWGEVYRSMTPQQLQWFREGLYLYFDSDSPDAEWKIAPDVTGELLKPHMGEDSSINPDGVCVRMRFSAERNIATVIGLLLGRSHHTRRDTGEVVVTSFGLVVGGLPGKVLPPSIASPEPNLPQVKDKFPEQKVTIGLDELAKEADIDWQPLDGPTIWANRSDVLAVLHEKLGMQIISDHHSRWCEWPAVKDQPLKDILDEYIGKRFYMGAIDSGAAWGWDGKLLYMRGRDYAQADSEEIPNRLLRRWQAIYKQQGYLDLDTLGEIAVCLGPSQIYALHNGPGDHCQLLGLAELYTGADCGISGNMGIFKIYGSLNTVQKRLAFGSGLRVDGLSNDQQLALARCLALGDGRPLKSDGVIYGAYLDGVRVDKPETPGPDSPVMISIIECGPRVGVGLDDAVHYYSEVVVCYKKKNSSARGYIIEKYYGEPTAEEAVASFHRAWPGHGNDKLLTQKRVIYKLVITRANGKTVEQPLGVAMDLVPVKSD